MKYESVMIFGNPLEIEGEEKLRVLLELVKKNAPGYETADAQYIDSQADKVRLFKLTVSALSGKSRRH